ncbi:MAG: DUF5127 domain-containing protein [Isosphaeraceae bacterium]
MRWLPTIAAALAAMSPLFSHVHADDKFRPPSVPLVVHDPYFSVWSNADRLTDDATRHWTLAPQPLVGLIRVDGKTYRVLGDEPKDIPALPQVGLEITATKTTARFEDAEVEASLSFLTPALPADLDLMARPVTYVNWGARSKDGKAHKASVFFGASGLLTVHEPGQMVGWAREKFGDIRALKLGTVEQARLERRGDFTRIDWGHLYLATSFGRDQLAIGSQEALVDAFRKGGKLPEQDDVGPRMAGDRPAMLAAVVEMPELDAEGVRGRGARLLLAYDDDVAINSMDEPLKAYWKRSGATIGDALQAASKDGREIAERCSEFDKDLAAMLEKVGGKRYATLCALAHRQSLAGSKLVADSKGYPLWFPKENTSNGCIATVDVLYPQFPHLLRLDPRGTAKATRRAGPAYSASRRWKFPFAPHDLGTYPAATGQVYGGGERTEENPDAGRGGGNSASRRSPGWTATPITRRGFWPQLTQWANSPRTRRVRPGNRSAPATSPAHLARNANLSIKATWAWPATASSPACGATPPPPKNTKKWPARWPASG